MSRFFKTVPFFTIFITIFGSITATEMPSQAQGRRSGDILPGRHIIVVHPGFAPETVAQSHKLQADAVYRFAVSGFAGPSTTAQAHALRDDPRVKSVEPDRLIVLDGVAAGASTSTVSAQTAQALPTGIDRTDSDLSTTASIDGIDTRVNADVAIIDTGIDLSHPDLYVVKSISFVKGVKSGIDDNGHGTHVAGTAAALDNSTGVVGVAPGARLWSVKVLNRQGSGTLSAIISGVDYVTQNANSIEVANMSLGFYGTSSALNSAIAKSVKEGVTYVVAAGNSASDAATFSPANHPDVICVSAIADSDGRGGSLGPPTCRSDADDTFADFSNYGSVVDIAAPGDCIYSTWKGSTYNTISGTSMASPHVAGAAALYKAKNPGASASVVKGALVTTGRAQNDSLVGFTGDPDGFPEPLMYAKGL